MLEVQLLWSKKFNYIASAFRIANLKKMKFLFQDYVSSKLVYDMCAIVIWTSILTNIPL